MIFIEMYFTKLKYIGLIALNYLIHVCCVRVCKGLILNHPPLLPFIVPQPLETGNRTIQNIQTQNIVNFFS